jgi:hypothetical protein
MAMQNALRIAVAALALCGCHDRLMPSAADSHSLAHDSMEDTPGQVAAPGDDSNQDPDGAQRARRTRAAARQAHAAKAQVEDASTDTCKNGGPSCSLEGAEELRLPSDSRTADVDYSRSRQFHFYKASFKEKGKLTVRFKVLHARRGSKVSAYLMKSQDDEGDRIAGNATREIESPGDVYIRVQAKDAGDRAKYAIATIFQPASFIPADVVEIGRNPCVLTVGAGTRQGVRAGVGCTVVNPAGQALDSCVVEQTFPNLAKVKPAGARCNLAPGCRVQIAAQ